MPDPGMRTFRNSWGADWAREGGYEGTSMSQAAFRRNFLGEFPAEEEPTVELQALSAEHMESGRTMVWELGVLRNRVDDQQAHHFLSSSMYYRAVFEARRGEDRYRREEVVPLEVIGWMNEVVVAHDTPGLRELMQDERIRGWVQDMYERTLDVFVTALRDRQAQELRYAREAIRTGGEPGAFYSQARFNDAFIERSARANNERTDPGPDRRDPL